MNSIIYSKGFSTTFMFVANGIAGNVLVGMIGSGKEGAEGRKYLSNEAVEKGLWSLCISSFFYGFGWSSVINAAMLNPKKYMMVPIAGATGVAIGVFTAQYPQTRITQHIDNYYMKKGALIKNKSFDH